MLRSIQQLYESKVGASDGELGQVKNLYFDDQTWAMRYLVVDTGSWLPGRQVLLAPQALGNPDPGGKAMAVNLTRKQIEDSPAIEWYQPVSRQFEEVYCRYYGWPCYWQNDGQWSLSRLPFSKPTIRPRANRRVERVAPTPKPAAECLRSTREAKGYYVQAGNGIIGHVSDFMVDVQSWIIRLLVIKTGQRVLGRELQIPTGKVDRICYDGLRDFGR
jgi:hypothetical protein